MTVKTILLVEDNPKDEALTKRALNQCNVANQIVVVRDGAEALDYLFADGAHAGRDTLARLAVILLDLRLPKVDGHEVLRRIRSDDRTKLLPVVILTSSDEEGDIVKSYSAGANSYVRKPVNFDDFARAVRDLGLFWLVTNVPPPSAGK